MWVFQSLIWRNHEEYCTAEFGPNIPDSTPSLPPHQKRCRALKTSFLCVHMDFLPFTSSPVISCFSKYQSGLYSLPKGSLGGTMYRAGGRASTSGTKYAVAKVILQYYPW
jgi:hypothetical protein